MTESTKKRYRRNSHNSISRAESSRSYSEMEKQGTEQDPNDRFANNEGMSTKEDYRQSPTNDPQIGIPNCHSGDLENNPFTDTEKDNNDKRNDDTADRISSTAAHARETQRYRSEREQEFPHKHSYADQQSDQSRLESPRRIQQVARDQKQKSSRDCDSVEDDEVMRNMARGLSSSQPTRNQHSTKPSRSSKQKNKDSDYLNGSETGSRGNNHRQDYTSRDRTNDRPHMAHSKYGPETVSNGRPEVQKEVSRPKIKPPEPTTVFGLAGTYIQYANEDGNWERCFEAFAHVMHDAIKQREDRVNALSEEMLAGRDRYQPITDGTFQDNMNLLRTPIKTLSRDLSKATKKVGLQENEFREILENRILSSKVDDTAWSIENRTYLIQSAVWRALKDHLFASPFQAFGNEGQELGKAWTILFTNEQNQDKFDAAATLGPTDLSEKWKSLTATRLEEKYRGSPGLGCESARQALLDLISLLTGDTLKYAADSGWVKNLNDALNQAAKLAIDMATQRSRLELYVPDVMALPRKRSENGNVHVLGRIIDVADESMMSGDILFVAIPGLRRWGDGLGMNLNRHVDLEPAHVRCTE